MAAPPTVKLERRGPVGVVTLARPGRHNAFDEPMIHALTSAVRALEEDAGIRAILLAAEGESFCAGADLEWMRRAAALGPEDGLVDAQRLATLLTVLDRCERPTVARVHGAARGGGVGLVAACDVALATPDATFALSEVTLGLVPAVIGPYVVAAVGERAARRYFLTGERFSADEAHRIGLVSEVAPDAAGLDALVARVLSALAANGPAAMREAKALLRALRGRPIDGALVDETARTLARVRASPEGREGIAAFLERRRPRWGAG
ncbi:MAG TPA: enoyl-CoA hydratase-related protein [Anaeromyxobacteraceae bacterium]|nr:enoyl-CoA hydratase-related protein [Anaeromyxobacteraceae bacterium]